MPFPPHICPCGNIVPKGAECSCRNAAKRARKRRYDRTRPTASQRGYGSKWRTARAAFLRINDRCAWPRCGAVATVVDHIIPHRGDDKLFWDRNNWQPLCKSCHDRHKQRQES